jgi:16S rRNA G1207 methylase RsmC
MHEHYYTEKPKSKVKYGLIKARLRGEAFEFLTASGVFSPKKIDRGTALLAEHMVIRDNARVLDLGCGYGVLGIVAARAAKGVEVVLTEVNHRAASLAEENLRRNDVANAEVRRGSLYEPLQGETFDVILCNLPMSAGLEVVYKIIEDAKEHLSYGGSLQVVVRKGAERIRQKMLAVYGNVAILAKKGGYRVFLAEKLTPG